MPIYACWDIQNNTEPFAEQVEALSPDKAALAHVQKLPYRFRLLGGVTVRTKSAEGVYEDWLVLIESQTTYTYTQRKIPVPAATPPACGDVCADDPAGAFPCVLPSGHHVSHQDAQEGKWARYGR